MNRNKNKNMRVNFKAKLWKLNQILVKRQVVDKTSVIQQIWFNIVNQEKQVRWLRKNRFHYLMKTNLELMTMMSHQILEMSMRMSFQYLNHPNQLMLKLKCKNNNQWIQGKRYALAMNQVLKTERITIHKFMQQVKLSQMEHFSQYHL